MKWWVAYADIDGFRLDAAKHKTTAWTAHFSVKLRAYAQSLGKDNFLVSGEILSPNAEIKECASVIDSRRHLPPPLLLRPPLPHRCC